MKQDVPLDVLVMDDASSDDATAGVVRQFPRARYVRSEQRVGYIVLRNRAARLASTDVLVSIDDDAVMVNPSTVSSALAAFVTARVGAVSLRHVNVLDGKVIVRYASLPDDERVFVKAEFVGTAYAVRREVFLGVGGYREHLVHQTEERDFCVRMLSAGYVVRAGVTPPIEHRMSPIRSHKRMTVYNNRNNLLFAWQNVPWPSLPVHVLGTTVNGLWTGLRWRRMGWTTAGLAQGYAAMVTGRYERRPVSRSIYQLHRRLIKCGPLLLDEIEGELPLLTSPGPNSQTQR